MRTRVLSLAAAAFVAAAALAAGPGPSAPPSAAAGTRLVGWNNLGMHCMDADFAVFSLLPPFNTVHAQLVRNGALVTSDAGVAVTYEAVTDATGSVNSASAPKTNFWQHVQELYGASPAPEVGLGGKAMPGALNTPQAMSWDAANSWWIAEGIPITPRDDAGAHNPYPMMRLVARDPAHAVIATTDVVLPVSDEMDCRVCHASTSGPAARPIAGWVNDPDPVRDHRLNILRLHDELNGGSALYASALAAMGYSPSGLYANVVDDGRAVLCGSCHSTAALGTAGFAGVDPLTRSVHWRHARVADPVAGGTLDDLANRAACYRCHPGSTTRCLRGAMGAAVAADGTMQMQCQSCHGAMSDVGAAGRQGWLEEPACQACHTGDAVTNSGQIRFTSAFDTPGHLRQPAGATFATNHDVPAQGLSLFRFSRGHGGLACEACHGPTHAESPSTHANDNAQALGVQGHVGPLAECPDCHGTAPRTVDSGPHGLHPVGQDWVNRHPDILEAGGAAISGCRRCHGADLRGTVLSAARADRSLSAFGTRSVFRGSIVGCWMCHAGPASDDANPNKPPVALDGTAATVVDTPVGVALAAADGAGASLTYRIVGQPANGTVALSNSQATYYPAPAFTGVDTFSWAARDGMADSNLATVQVQVGGALALPDLTAQWLSVRLRKSGKKTTVEAKLLVHDTGPASAGPTRLVVGLSSDGTLHATDPVLATIQVGAISAGKDKKVTVKAKLQAGISATGKFLIAAVNADGALPEASTSNNTAAFGPLK